jgi:hypothetical protein
MEYGHMADESSTFGLNREKLAKLWKLGDGAVPDPQPADADQDKAELLRSQLAESLPLEAGMARMLPGILTAVCEKLRPFTGCSFEALLLDPATDLSVVETIKDLHKERAESSLAGPKQEVATAIYYTAIAGALIHHDAKITKLSYESLSQSFAELSVSEWLPAGIKKLLGLAHDLCVGRANKSEK